MPSLHHPCSEEADIFPFANFLLKSITQILHYSTMDSTIPQAVEVKSSVLVLPLFSDFYLMSHNNIHDVVEIYSRRKFRSSQKVS